jgi:hypothetical protein
MRSLRCAGPPSDRGRPETRTRHPGRHSSGQLAPPHPARRERIGHPRHPDPGRAARRIALARAVVRFTGDRLPQLTALRAPGVSAVGQDRARVADTPAQQDAVWERTCAHNKLRSLLPAWASTIRWPILEGCDGAVDPWAGRPRSRFSVVRLVLVVQAPPLVGRGLRAAIRGVLPGFLAAERGDVEHRPGRSERVGARNSTHVL